MNPTRNPGWFSQKSGIDNIFALKVAGKREINKNGSMFVFFADPKAAFDRVDRKILYMRKYGIHERLIRVVERLYRKTSCRIRIGVRWTERGALSQGCPLSYLLLLILVFGSKNREFGNKIWK